MPVKAKNYKALTGQGQGETKKYTLVEMGDLCNENLLDNSDFRKGVINQNGQTSYTGKEGRSTFGIDRWFIADNIGNKVNVYDGYVAFTLANGSSINQYVYRFDENETNYTFAIKLKNSELKIIHLTLNNTTGTLLQDNIYVVLRNFTDGDNPNNDFQLYFANRSGSVKTLNIEYMKLEKGLYFTGMPIWDYVKEVSNAHRKMIGLGSIQAGEVSIGTANFFNAEVWIMIPLTNYFDRKPTVYTTGTIKLILDGYDEATITNLSVTSFSNQSAIVKGTLSKSLSSHNGKIGKVIMTTGSRIVFDGNDY